ncbi:MAG: hypothetical protein HY067_17055 [Betaproteobacteria bacterium]|nr:hypothetical protein [Betaproteobacteria bacterium]
MQFYFTNGVKDLLLKRSGLDPMAARDYELDHIIPLVIGVHPRGAASFEGHAAVRCFRSQA